MDKKELDNLKDISELSKTAGGMSLIENSKKVCIDIIGNISNNYINLDEVYLKTLCARLNINLSMYQLLTGIDDNIKAIEELLKPEE